MEERQPRIQEFRGKPILILPHGIKGEFKFGLFKANLILKNLDAIRDFAFSRPAPESEDA